VIGSAGSIFKNPDDNIYAGKLIEEAGLKGCRIGKAYVSRKHANFILTDKGAKAQDILDLMEYIQEKVYKMFGIKLIPEVIVIGEK
jgi:UDP-N-acetylmuramate dehydrogenase